MLTTYWSAKGGSGTTVVATAHAIVAARARPTLLVDLDGDCPAVLGVEAPAEGVTDWLTAGPSVAADSLERLLHPVADGLWLLARGSGMAAPERADVLAGLLAGMPRDVIVDAGTHPDVVGQTVARASDRSVLVVRACYLAVRRALAAPLAPTDIVVVREALRALRTADVVAAVGAPARHAISVDPAIANAVDAGLLAARLPRALDRCFRRDGDHRTPRTAHRTRR